MIRVNMHDAKSRLSELVKAVEDGNETVLLCRNGHPVAEIRATRRPAKVNRLQGSPELKVKLAPEFDPIEPATEQDWPAALR
jgi:antitoxin (DNA-binding transcriptional repressor) of toxin-antitoxin stability system